MFSLIVSAFTGICAFEIVKQVWFADAGAAPVNCRPGLSGLVRAVDRAREAAARAAGERAALDAFRRGLMPEWNFERSVERACESDPKIASAFREVERYRFAEEHAVRHEASDLAARRRRIRELEQELEQR